MGTTFLRTWISNTEYYGLRIKFKAWLNYLRGKYKLNFLNVIILQLALVKTNKEEDLMTFREKLEEQWKNNGKNKPTTNVNMNLKFTKWKHRIMFVLNAKMPKSLKNYTFNRWLI